MKKLGIVLLLVLTLITTSFTVQAQDVSSLTLQERINNQELSIIESESVIYIDENNNETDTVHNAIKARLTYKWALSDDDWAAVESGDTYSFNLSDEYTVNEILLGEMSENGRFTVSGEEITLTFEKNSASGLGSFEFLVALNPEKKESEVLEVLEVPAVSEGPMNIKDRLGITSEIITDYSIKFDGLTPDDPEFFPKLDSKVDIRIEWSLHEIEPDVDDKDIKPRDYYEFKMPTYFKFTEMMNGTLDNNLPLDHPDYILYATYTVSVDGDLRIEFTEEVQVHDDVEGELRIEGKLDETLIKVTGEIVIEFPYIEGADITINLKPNNDGKAIEKSGRLNKHKNATEITWDVIINKSYDSLSDVVVEDLLPSHLTLSQIKIYELSYPITGSSQNTPIYSETSLDQSAYTTDGTKVSFNSSINKPYAIRYVTKIDEDIINGTEEYASFTNKATITSKDKGTISTESTIWTSYGKYLAKSGWYNKYDDLINWTITFNGREVIQNNPVLEDVFGENLVYKDGSIKIKTQSGTELLERTDFTFVPTNDKTGFKLEFLKDINEELQITYETEFKEGIIHGNGSTYKNTVTGGDIEVGSDVYVRSYMLEKWVGNTNYEDKTIDWNIELNDHKYEVNNGVITDVYTR